MEENSERNPTPDEISKALAEWQRDYAERRRKAHDEFVERKRQEAENDPLPNDLEPGWPKIIELNLHSDGDSLKETAISEFDIDLPLTDRFWDKFLYALNDVEFQLELNRDGTYWIKQVRDRAQVLRDD